MVTVGKRRDADPVDLVAHETAVLIRRAESARKRAQTLDRSAYLLLDAIAVQNPLALGALAERFQLDNSTVSRQVAVLEARSLVERRVDPADGRVFRLAITETGMTQLRSARKARHDLFADLLASWSDEERHALGAALRRFNEEIARRDRRTLQRSPSPTLRGSHRAGTDDDA